MTMHDSIRSDILPFTFHFGPLAFTVDEISVRAAAGYQKPDQLGANTLDRITSVWNETAKKMDLLNGEMTKLNQMAGQRDQQVDCS